MNTNMIKENLTPGIWGAVLGAAALAIVGFNWGGWVTGNTAKEMAQAAIVDRLVDLRRTIQRGLQQDRQARRIEKHRHVEAGRLRDQAGLGHHARHEGSQQRGCRRLRDQDRFLNVRTNLSRPRP